MLREAAALQAGALVTEPAAGVDRALSVLREAAALRMEGMAMDLQLAQAGVDRAHGALSVLREAPALQMEGMVTDLQLAREKQADFDRWKRENNRQLLVEMSVTVLTTGFWPTYKAGRPARLQASLLAACTCGSPALTSRQPPAET